MELLIVISVIAILATISIVSYRGVQDRADAAKAAAAAEYVKLFELYRYDHGRYPRLYTDSNYETTACLGPSDSFPANDDFEAGECVGWDDSNRHSTSEYLAELLRPYEPQLPATNLRTVSLDQSGNGWYSNVKFRGLVYYGGMNGDGYIHYFVKGNQDCPKGTAFAYNGITECIISLKGDDLSGGYGYERGVGGEG